MPPCVPRRFGRTIRAMNRREALQVATATAVAHSLVNVFGCAATPKAAEAPAPGPQDRAPVPVSPVTPAFTKAAEAAAHCATVGETCLEHCIRDLSTGSTMMADCAKSVQQMLAMCRAMASLAAMGSRYAKELAPLCAKVCANCHAECEKHAGHHAECKACSDSCAVCEEACRALA